VAARKQILVADGDSESRERIAASLAVFDVTAVARGDEALAWAQREKPDLVVLDLGLQGISGLGLCRLLREDPALGHTGIVMVTAHASEVDRILAFEAGVDDLLPKPFYGRELASRVAAVLRRSSPQRGLAGPCDAPARGLVTLHAATNSVLVGERRLDLTPREYQLLSALMRHAGRVLTRQQLIARVWGGESDHTDRVVDAHIKSIRRKLAEAKDCLETVRGVGYRFSDAGPA
jgi:DNA-binding response OmpR family regulator